MDTFLTPYRICVAILINQYAESECDKQEGILFIRDLMRHHEHSFKQLYALYEANAKLMKYDIINFKAVVQNMYYNIEAMNRFFEERHPESAFKQSWAGLHFKRVASSFHKLTHQAETLLYDEYRAYVGENPWDLTKLTEEAGDTRTINQVNHEISKLQTNELRAMDPKALSKLLREPHNSTKSDAIFLRYLNFLRVNEYVASKHLLMAYFDMVPVSRSYSALNYAIWYLHHCEYNRAIECLQECYFCAQSADDDKCLLLALMWLARIVIQAQLKNSSKFNVTALLDLLITRCSKANLPYVQAMASMTLEQLVGAVDDTELLKKASETLKQVTLSGNQQNQLLMNANQQNTLDKDDVMPTGELLAVRNSMNDVLAMHYALQAAQLTVRGCSQTSALSSQVLLHFDLIEKSGTEDVFLLNENIFIAVRNLAYHVWNTTRNLGLVREILIDLCSNHIPLHRTDYHSIWHQAFSEIQFDHYIEESNFCEASRFVALISETDPHGAQLRQAELYKLRGSVDKSLELLDDLIAKIEVEEQRTIDGDMSHSDMRKRAGDSHDAAETQAQTELQSPSRATSSIEHKAFIKAKALLERAILLEDEIGIKQSLQYATDNGFKNVRTACLLELANCWVRESNAPLESIVIEVFANGTRKEKQKLKHLISTTTTTTAM